MSTYEERKKSGLSRDLARKLKRKKRLRRKSRHQRRSKRKSVESSWSIGHILEHELAVWAVRALRKKSGFEVFKATFEGGFFNFLWSKKNYEF